MRIRPWMTHSETTTIGSIMSQIRRYRACNFTAHDPLVALNASVLIARARPTAAARVIARGVIFCSFCISTHLLARKYRGKLPHHCCCHWCPRAATPRSCYARDHFAAVYSRRKLAPPLCSPSSTSFRPNIWNTFETSLEIALFIEDRYHIDTININIHLIYILIERFYLKLEDEGVDGEIFKINRERI